jgi:hypothetical protein
MKHNEAEAKWYSKSKSKRPWEPMKLSYTGHIGEAVKAGVITPPPGNETGFG